jgi:hypothetical protein
MGLCKNAPVDRRRACCTEGAQGDMGDEDRGYLQYNISSCRDCRVNEESHLIFSFATKRCRDEERASPVGSDPVRRVAGDPSVIIDGDSDVSSIPEVFSGTRRWKDARMTVVWFSPLMSSPSLPNPFGPALHMFLLMKEFRTPPESCFIMDCRKRPKYPWISTDELTP